MDAVIESTYMKELADGSQKAFDALFMYYHPRVKSFLTGFIGDAEEAADMAQDVFYKIWMNRTVFAKVDSFRSYLFRMARNLVYDYYEHSLVKENYDLTLRNRPQYEDLIEEDLYVKELSLLIDIAVENMPEQRKRIFKMSRKEGLSNDEIAVRLEINKRTVENHLTQALANLRKALSTVRVFF